jgi:hypothetical protein
MGGGSAGRNATSVAARELAGFEVELDPVSGACLLQASSIKHKTKQTTAATPDCRRLLGAPAD